MSRNVAIYARVSTEHEAQLSALDNQVQYYEEELAKHPDWKLYDKYIDEGITGTSVNKRRNFLRMIRDAEAGHFDLIVTREVSRFARNTVDTLQETRKLKRIGVEVYFIEDNIWTLNDEDGELKLTIMATLAQNESKKISQRVKAGQKITFLNGVFYGNGNILGYDKVGKDMVVNEEQAKVVKYIFSSFLMGKGSSQIKYDLEKQGFLTATGKKNWHAESVIGILRNPFYCGTIVYRKSYIPDYLEQKAKINHGEVEQIVVEGRHTPLVSKEDFEKVQKILDEHSKLLNIKKNAKKGVGIPTSIWSKKLVCECGASYNKEYYHKATETRPATYQYRCYNQKANGSLRVRQQKELDITGACDLPNIPEWKLNVIATIVFESLCSNKERILKIVNNIVDQTIKDNVYRDDISDEIKSYESKIESVEEKQNKLVDGYIAGIFSQDIYLRKKEELDNSIKSYNDKIIELKQKLGVPKQTLELRVNKIKEILQSSLNINDVVLSEEVIDSFIDKIVVHRDRFELKLSFLEDIIDFNNIDTNESSLAQVLKRNGIGKIEKTKDDNLDIPLFKLAITNDDIERVKNTTGYFKTNTLKEPIYVEVYI